MGGATSYRVYKASSYLNQKDDPAHQYENWVFRPIANTAAPSFTETNHVEASRLAVAAVDANGKEGPLSTRFFAPVLWNPQAVGVLADSTRIVLDPQGGSALLAQTSDGGFVESIGSVHYHLELTRFMAVDQGLGRLIFSHPGDYYTDRHSIRVADLNSNPLLEFGFTGSGPGDFKNPAGVAVDAEHRIYVVDSGNNRLQIFTGGGALIAAFGTGGSGPGEFFDAQGIAVDSFHRIYVCDRGNRRVQILQFNGTSVTCLGTLSWSFSEPFAVAIGPGGTVYVSDTDHSTVEAFTESGNWLATYRTPTDGAAGNLLHPTGLAVGQLGELIISDSGNRRIVTIAPSEVIAERFLTLDRSSNGIVMLTLEGPPGRRLEIEGSTNLLDWQQLFVLTNQTGTLTFTDTNAASVSQKFYRSVFRP